MKTLIGSIALSVFTLTSVAADKNPSNMHPHKYCAKMKGGEISVMHEEKELTTEATLNDGSKISVNGTVTRKDGTKISLKEGQCIDKDGKIMEEKTMKKK